AALAGAVLISFIDGLAVVVGAPRAVARIRVRAHTGGRIAAAGDVALIGGRAGLPRAALAGAVLTGVIDGAGVVVGAPRAIGRIRVRAHAGGRIAAAGDVALIGGRAGLPRAALARAVLTGAIDGAGVV